VVRHATGDDDIDLGEAVAAGAHAQPDLAIVNQQVGTRSQGVENLRMRQAHAMPVTWLVAEIEPERPARLEIEATVRESADAQLGPLPVQQHDDEPAGLALDVADQPVARSVVGMAAMTAVEPEHVGTGLEHGLDRGPVRTG
jgi:hypothetical protein